MHNHVSDVVAHVGQDLEARVDLENSYTIDAETSYVQHHRQERLLPNTYVLPHRYEDRRIIERRDLQRFIPSKVVEKFPRNGNEGLYGYTFLGDIKIRKQEGLDSYADLLTDIHESTHTEWEYQTRIWSEMIMASLFPEQERYHTKPKEYRT